MNYSTGIILIGHFLIGGSLIAQNSPNPTTVQPTQNQQATTQISVNSQTAVTIDAAPINIMAQPPEDEFKDEFGRKIEWLDLGRIGAKAHPD